MGKKALCYFSTVATIYEKEAILLFSIVGMKFNTMCYTPIPAPQHINTVFIVHMDFFLPINIQKQIFSSCAEFQMTNYSKAFLSFSDANVSKIPGRSTSPSQIVDPIHVPLAEWAGVKCMQEGT